MIDEISVTRASSLNQLEIDALEDVLRKSYTGDSVEDMAQRILSGQSALWRVIAAGLSILVETQVLQHKSGKELFVYTTVGHGALRYLDQLREWLEELARAANCRFVGGVGVRPGWGRLLGDHCKTMTQFVREVPNGQIFTC